MTFPCFAEFSELRRVGLVLVLEGLRPHDFSLLCLCVCKPSIEKHTENCKRYIPFIGGDFNAELGPAHGNECDIVGSYTVNEGNKRGDWMKHWMMLQGYTALNTIYRKTPQKQTTFLSPKGKEN